MAIRPLRWPVATMNMLRRSTLPVQVIVRLTSLALGGCQRHPDLVDTLGTAIDDEAIDVRGDWRERAPIVVVASVDENRIIAKHVEASRYQGLFLDLHVVRCKRENSLKGGLTGPELTFFYFADGRYSDSKSYRRSKSLFQATPGSRYLFFLTRDRSVLRSIGDVGEYQVLVATGTHPESATTGGDTGRLVSQVLLTPGNGADLDLMVKRLYDYSAIADIWGSRPLSVQLLRHLASHAEPLRFAAGGVLVERYHGQEDCLQALVDDPNESSQFRQEAMRELKEQGASRQRFLESVKDPATETYLNCNRDSRRRVREEFETMLLGTDVLVRERACTALKRYFPWDAEPTCSGVKVHFAEH